MEHLTLDMLLKLKKVQYVDEGESILLNGNPVAVDEIWVNGSGQMNITTVQEAQARSQELSAAYTALKEAQDAA